MNTSGKICSICNTENAHTAFVCSNCGATLEENQTTKVAITENIGGQAYAPVENVESFIDVALIPEEGVGIYVAGAVKPYYLHVYKELIIGRPTDAALESILDLTDLDAAAMGVSRRHVMIRRTDSGFEVVDLSSRNGTWLNAERLTPNRSYPFASGSQIRLGRLQLFVIYHTVLKGAKKK